MKEIIVAKLAEIEKKENVRVIHAVESGSRAWGFASPDSDYDVRFIYVRPKEFYLRLDKTRDVIEWQLDETLDINGWDLQKSLRLLHTSNPTLFEWSNSPIVYKTTDEWTIIQKEINHYFLAKSGLYHYLSTATGNYREYLKGDMVKLKKYFYVIRPIIARLLEQKANMPEMGEDKRIDKLNDYIDANLISLKTAIDDLPKEHKEDWNRLNELFLSIVR